MAHEKRWLPAFSSPPLGEITEGYRPAYSSAFLAAAAPLREVEGGRFLVTKRTIGVARTIGGSKRFLQNEPNLSFISLRFFGFA